MKYPQVRLRIAGRNEIAWRCSEYLSLMPNEKGQLGWMILVMPKASHNLSIPYNNWEIVRMMPYDWTRSDCFGYFCYFIDIQTLLTDLQSSPISCQVRTSQAFPTRFPSKKPTFSVAPDLQELALKHRSQLGFAEGPEGLLSRDHEAGMRWCLEVCYVTSMLVG